MTLVSRIALAGVVSSALACGPVGLREPDWPPTGKKWFDRASESYRTGDIEDAHLAVVKALRVVPDRDEVRLLGARVALAQLEFDETIRLTEGLASTDARGVRGRALWYGGQLERAADELDQLLADPEVRDPWASDIAKLARRGSGRTPFRMTGAMLAAVEMPRVAATSLIVPLEVNGEQALGLIATRMAEAVVDSKAGSEPAWVSLRFGERVEVKDVPALAQDLSGISRELNAPIKILLGVNLLRHLRPTFDFRGSQFVVRNFDPPPPPDATTVKLNYVKGGGMLMRGGLGSRDGGPEGAFLIDTLMTFPIALDDAGWKKAGVGLSTLESVPNQSSLKYGRLPMLRVGAFELPEVTGVYGAPVQQLADGLEIELDGLVGSGLLAEFRVTLVDAGRTMWLEPMPMAPALDPANPAAPASDDAPAGVPGGEGVPDSDKKPAAPAESG